MNVSPEHGPPGGGSRLPLGLEIGVSSGMMAVAIITVALRFISRRLAKAKLLLDDWTALIALVSLYPSYRQLVYFRGFDC